MNNDIYKCLDKILRIYNKGGYKISNITCNNGFKKIFEKVDGKLDVSIEYTNLNNHKPHAEWNNRTIKNQVRMGLHRSTYKAIPQVMIKHLVVSCTDKFNLFPAKYGVSDYYSPETLVTGKVFDYLKHCQCKFGDYIQAQDYNDPHNDMGERCLDGIYLRPHKNGTGHYIMDLHTGREITQGGKLTVIPLLEPVKNSVEKMGQRQGFKTLKFKKKSRQTMDHKDLVPGINCNILNDYEEDVEDREELFEEHSKLVKEIDRSGLNHDQVVLICFNAEVIRKFKKVKPKHKAYWLCSFRKKKGVLTPDLKTIMDTLKSTGADGLDSHFSIPEEFSQAVLDAGYEWHVWTVNDPDMAKELVQRGVHSITTDRPGFLRDVL